MADWSQSGGGGTAEQAPYKVILAGMKGVGKTSLLRMLDEKVDTGFEDRQLLLSLSKGASSRGRTKLKLRTNCGGNNVLVDVWDTGDMEKESGSVGLTRSYFRDSHGAILVYERGKDESKMALRQWADPIRAESPDCVLSLWCNNRQGEFGGAGSQTRDFVNDLTTHYKISPLLMFTYTPGDAASVHQHFNTLMCKVHSQQPEVPIRDSISLPRYEEKKNSWKKKCGCQRSQ